MLNNTLSIHDLISMLEDLKEQYGEDTLVVASSDYGDHSHTEQLVEITDVSVTNPVKSGYSQSGWAFGDEEDFDDEKPFVVVLKGV